MYIYVQLIINERLRIILLIFSISMSKYVYLSMLFVYFLYVFVTYHHALFQLYEKIQKYNISLSDIYNFDEKGFLIGLSRATKRVISVNALKSKRTARALQDSSREFITLITSICTYVSWATWRQDNAPEIHEERRELSLPFPSSRVESLL